MSESLTTSSAPDAPITATEGGRRSNAWIAWSVIPWLNWIAWIHAAIRTRRLVYIIWASLYGVPFAMAGASAGEPSDLPTTLAIVSWLGGIAHALWWRKQVGAEMEDAGSRKSIKGWALVVALLLVGVPSTYQALDPSGTRENRIRDLRTPRLAAATAQAGGVIYVLGGVDRRGEFVSVVETYQVETNEWRARSPLQTSRAMAAAVAHGDRIVVVGGRNSAGVLDSVELYDPGRDQWSSLPPLPFPRWGHTATVAGDRLYVAGGIRGTGDQRDAIADVDIFDFTRNIWVRGPSLPAARQGGASAVANGRLYILGGQDGPGTKDQGPRTKDQGPRTKDQEPA